MYNVHAAVARARSQKCGACPEALINRSNIILRIHRSVFVQLGYIQYVLYVCVCCVQFGSTCMLMFYAVLVHVLVCWCVFYRAAQVCYVQLTRMFVCMLSAQLSQMYMLCTITANMYVVGP